MKRAFFQLLLSSLLLSGVAVRAADVVALAAQQEMIDNYKVLAATVEQWRTDQVAQQKQISALTAELGKLREEMARNNKDAAQTAQIRHLEEQVAKVDKARLADNEQTKKALDDLGVLIKKAAVTPPPRRPPVIPSTSNGAGPVMGAPAAPRGSGNTGGSTTAPQNAVEEGFDYTVVSGDHPERIATKYRAEGVNVTASSIIKANPAVDWTKLKVGQKLFIPKPKS